MPDVAPEAVITISAFRNETVNVWLLFQIPARGVKNHDKTGSEVHGFILFKKHAGNNAVYRMKKAAGERAAIQEKIPELLINGKDTMAVGNIDQFKGHRGSALHGIFIAAGGAETAVAAERDGFQLSTVGTAVHGTAGRRITTADHFIDIFHLSLSGMKSIFNFFIMVCKNSL